MIPAQRGNMLRGVPPWPVAASFPIAMFDYRRWPFQEPIKIGGTYHISGLRKGYVRGYIPKYGQKYSHWNRLWTWIIYQIPVASLSFFWKTTDLPLITSPHPELLQMGPFKIVAPKNSSKNWSDASRCRLGISQLCWYHSQFAIALRPHILFAVDQSSPNLLINSP